MLHLISSRRTLKCMIAESREKSYARFLLQNLASSFKFISSISNPIITKPHSFTLSYLINSCGLSPESALSVSKKLNLKTPENPNSVIELLRKHGFADTQITKMVTKFPSLLLSDPNKTLSPKIDVFKRYGVSGPDLTKIISSSPSLFQASVNKQIIPSFDFLRSVVHTDENVSATLRRSSRLFQSNLEKKIAPNISIIRSHGVPDSNIAKLIVTHPRTVLLGVERFGEIVAFVKEMDFNPLSANFTFAIRVMSGMKKSNWERKMKVYERLGWSKEEFLSAFKVQPKCMMVSEEKIVKVAEFLQCEMGWKPSILAKCPNLLLYSLEKRTIPRCLLLRILIKKGLIMEEPGLFWMLNICEKQFLEKILIKYQDLVPEIVTVYQGTMGHVL
eukprot:TRINITY_DN5837_c0_g1_i1.p1 TRINITY_DN5837_c0_g1~~TRINITY_DN5837_c0_g1_i1.p1  ORF type:complete len:389 (-),score=49.62 TRINITY_DN5837_c0_g1_i1:736-1902(-)